MKVKPHWPPSLWCGVQGAVLLLVVLGETAPTYLRQGDPRAHESLSASPSRPNPHKST